MTKHQSIFYIFLMFILFFVSGCGENPAQKLYTHMENAVEYEKDFEEQQKPLSEAEQKEHQLYEQIISLGVDEYDRIIENSKEAIKIVGERKEIINKEKTSIEASYEEFLKINESIDELEGETKQTAQELNTLMTNRYETYLNLYNEYSKALEYDHDLYEMLQKEGLTIDELQEQINKINDAYEDVIKKKEEFNSYTEEYNLLKKEFYEKAGLEVVYNET